MLYIINYNQTGVMCQGLYEKTGRRGILQTGPDAINYEQKANEVGSACGTATRLKTLGVQKRAFALPHGIFLGG